MKKKKIQIHSMVLCLFVQKKGLSISFQTKTGVSEGVIQQNMNTEFRPRQ